MSKGKAIFCIATSEFQAESIVHELKEAGFSDNDISVLFPDRTGSRKIAHESAGKASEGAATGAGTGGVVGGALGWLAGIGTLAIPGAGVFLATGPIMAALSGAAVGAAVGGIAGVLTGMGIPEFDARRYEGTIQAGNILISVHTEDGQECKKAQQILERLGAQDIASTTEAQINNRNESRKV